MQNKHSRDTGEVFIHKSRKENCCCIAIVYLPTNISHRMSKDTLEAVKTCHHTMTSNSRTRTTDKWLQHNSRFTVNASSEQTFTRHGKSRVHSQVQEGKLLLHSLPPNEYLTSHAQGHTWGREDMPPYNDKQQPYDGQVTTTQQPFHSKRKFYKYIYRTPFAHQSQLAITRHIQT